MSGSTGSSISSPDDHIDYQGLNSSASTRDPDAVTAAEAIAGLKTPSLLKTPTMDALTKKYEFLLATDATGKEHLPRKVTNPQHNNKQYEEEEENSKDQAITPSAPPKGKTMEGHTNEPAHHRTFRRLHETHPPSPNGAQFSPAQRSSHSPMQRPKKKQHKVDSTPVSPPVNTLCHSRNVTGTTRATEILLRYRQGEQPVAATSTPQRHEKAKQQPKRPPQQQPQLQHTANESSALPVWSGIDIQAEKARRKERNYRTQLKQNLEERIQLLGQQAQREEDQQRHEPLSSPTTPYTLQTPPTSYRRLPAEEAIPPSVQFSTGEVTTPSPSRGTNDNNSKHKKLKNPQHLPVGLRLFSESHSTSKQPASTATAITAALTHGSSPPRIPRRRSTSSVPVSPHDPNSSCKENNCPESESFFSDDNTSTWQRLKSAQVMLQQQREQFEQEKAAWHRQLESAYEANTKTQALAKRMEGQLLEVHETCFHQTNVNNSGGSSRLSKEDCVKLQGSLREPLETLNLLLLQTAEVDSCTTMDLRESSFDEGDLTAVATIKGNSCNQLEESQKQIAVLTNKVRMLEQVGEELQQKFHQERKQKKELEERLHQIQQQQEQFFSPVTPRSSRNIATEVASPAISAMKSPIPEGEQVKALQHRLWLREKQYEKERKDLESKLQKLRTEYEIYKDENAKQPQKEDSERSTRFRELQLERERKELENQLAAARNEVQVLRHFEEKTKTLEATIQRLEAKHERDKIEWEKKLRQKGKQGHVRSVSSCSSGSKSSANEEWMGKQREMQLSRLESQLQTAEAECLKYRAEVEEGLERECALLRAKEELEQERLQLEEFVQELQPGEKPYQPQCDSDTAVPAKHEYDGCDLCQRFQTLQQEYEDDKKDWQLQVEQILAQNRSPEVDDAYNAASDERASTQHLIAEIEELKTALAIQRKHVQGLEDAQAEQQLESLLAAKSNDADSQLQEMREELKECRELLKKERTDLGEVQHKNSALKESMDELNLKLRHESCRRTEQESANQKLLASIQDLERRLCDAATEDQEVMAENEALSSQLEQLKKDVAPSGRHVEVSGGLEDRVDDLSKRNATLEQQLEETRKELEATLESLKAEVKNCDNFTLEVEPLNSDYELVKRSRENDDEETLRQHLLDSESELQETRMAQDQAVEILREERKEYQAMAEKSAGFDRELQRLNITNKMDKHQWITQLQCLVSEGECSKEVMQMTVDLRQQNEILESELRELMKSYTQLQPIADQTKDFRESLLEDNAALKVQIEKREEEMMELLAVISSTEADRDRFRAASERSNDEKSRLKQMQEELEAEKFELKQELLSVELQLHRIQAEHEAACKDFQTQVALIKEFQANQLNKTYCGLLHNSEEKKEEHENEQAELKSQLQALIIQHESVQKEWQMHLKAFTEIQGSQLNKNESYEREMKELLAQTVSAKAKCERYRSEAEHHTMIIARLTQQNDQLEAEKTALSKHFDSLEQQLKGLQQQWQDQLESFAGMQDGQLAKSNQELNEALMELQKHRSSAEHGSQVIAKLEGDKALLQQMLDSSEQQLRALQAQIVDLQQELKAQVNSCADVQQKHLVMSAERDAVAISRLSMQNDQLEAEKFEWKVRFEEISQLRQHSEQLELDKAELRGRLDFAEKQLQNSQSQYTAAQQEWNGQVKTFAEIQEKQLEKNICHDREMKETLAQMASAQAECVRYRTEAEHRSTEAAKLAQLKDLLEVEKIDLKMHFEQQLENLRLEHQEQLMELENYRSAAQSASDEIVQLKFQQEKMEADEAKLKQILDLSEHKLKTLQSQHATLQHEWQSHLDVRADGGKLECYSKRLEVDKAELRESLAFVEKKLQNLQSQCAASQQEWNAQVKKFTEIQENHLEKDRRHEQEMKELLARLAFAEAGCEKYRSESQYQRTEISTLMQQNEKLQTDMADVIKHFDFVEQQLKNLQQECREQLKAFAEIQNCQLGVSNQELNIALVELQKHRSAAEQSSGEIAQLKCQQKQLEEDKLELKLMLDSSDELLRSLQSQHTSLQQDWQAFQQSHLSRTAEIDAGVTRLDEVTQLKCHSGQLEVDKARLRGKLNSVEKELQTLQSQYTASHQEWSLQIASFSEIQQRQLQMNMESEVELKELLSRVITSESQRDNFKAIAEQRMDEKMFLIEVQDQLRAENVELKSCFASLEQKIESKNMECETLRKDLQVMAANQNETASFASAVEELKVEFVSFGEQLMLSNKAVRDSTDSETESFSSAVQELKQEVTSIGEQVKLSNDTLSALADKRIADHIFCSSSFEKIQNGVNMAVEALTQESRAIEDGREIILKRLDIIERAASERPEERGEFCEEQRALFKQVADDIRAQCAVMSNLPNFQDEESLRQSIHDEYRVALHQCEVNLARVQSELEAITNDLAAERERRQAAENEAAILSDQLSLYNDEMNKLQNMSVRFELQEGGTSENHIKRHDISALDDEVLTPDLDFELRRLSNEIDVEMQAIRAVCEIEKDNVHDNGGTDQTDDDYSAARAAMFAQTVLLVTSLRSLMCCDSKSDENEAELVMRQLETLSELMGEVDRETAALIPTKNADCLGGQGYFERQHDSAAFLSRNEPAESGDHNTQEPDILQYELEQDDTILDLLHSYTDHDNLVDEEDTTMQTDTSRIELMVEQTYQKCRFLERERCELIEVTLQLLAAAKESGQAELDAALATARRKASEEMLAMRQQTQAHVDQIWGRLCGNCQRALVTG